MPAASVQGSQLKQKCGQAGDVGILALTGLTNLEELDISQTAARQSGLELMPHLRCLRRLSLASCRFPQLGTTQLSLMAQTHACAVHCRPS